MAYKPIDSRRDDYRKYLERNGVMETLTKVLCKLMLQYESDKQDDAIEFIRKNLGDAVYETDLISSLRSQLEESRKEIEDLKRQIRDLKEGKPPVVEEAVSPREEPAVEEKSPDENKEEKRDEPEGEKTTEAKTDEPDDKTSVDEPPSVTSDTAKAADAADSAKELNETPASPPAEGEGQKEVDASTIELPASPKETAEAEKA
ncbi:c-Myc-binding protein homolog [Phlebotomus argentipes]|uniref:c-Myc-binding protein homolog n=1 Tax=Phlebotomus argentipes TaxID=94469 RepID=UPI0028934FE6|nr:c-Myc-binding protein homolog [Phlebotomus argentipes]